MLHKFFEPGDWFAAKRVGYGAGLPIAWQGWFLLVAYILLMAGLAFTAEYGDFTEKALAWTGMAFATLFFVLVAKARTKGGWKWRK